LEDLTKVISNVNGKKFRTKKSASHTVSTASSEECIIGDIKYTLANVEIYSTPAAALLKLLIATMENILPAPFEGNYLGKSLPQVSK
jgi:hypothetical protein